MNSNYGHRTSLHRVALVELLVTITASVTSIAQISSLPQIRPAISLQPKAVVLGRSTSLAVMASGAALTYQWRLDGHDLLGETNKTIRFASAQAGDEGDYTVEVRNADGAAVSAPARLWVVPPSTNFVKSNFTNDARLRLPYFIAIPTNYDPAKTYPLVCQFYGVGGDEANFPGFAETYPETRVFASHRQQAIDPAIVVCPNRRAGDGTWSTQYLEQVLGLVDYLMFRFNVDTNRVYVGGVSGGVHAAWDLIGMRSGFFAGAFVAAGWQGDARATSLKDVPFWVACAADDEWGQLEPTRSVVLALRSGGARAIYTEYKSGEHFGGIFMAMSTPAQVNWLLAQRRGALSIGDPLLLITHRTNEAIVTTGAPTLNLAGSAQALGQPIIRVTWTNTVNKTGAIADGTNAWTAQAIPLTADKTNVIIVTGTTTSWAPAFGGATTFNDTLAVVSSPIRMSIARRPLGITLDWTGGAPPYAVQQTSDLRQPDWSEVRKDALPPLTLPVGPGALFYRVTGK